MGGGDLNMKKHFHPLTMENLERVWKAEEKKRLEEEKMHQLQEELAREREREAFQRQAVESGLQRKKQEKLDWMYSHMQTVNSEAYLLGKKIDKNVDAMKEDEKQIDLVPLASNRGPVMKASEILAKVKEDPLFLIKKKEEENRKDLVSNPIKMRKLKAMLEKEVIEKRSSGKMSKHSKKRKHKHHRHKESSSPERSPIKKNRSFDDRRESERRRVDDDSERRNRRGVDYNEKYSSTSKSTRRTEEFNERSNNGRYRNSSRSPKSYRQNMRNRNDERAFRKNDTSRKYYKRHSDEDDSSDDDAVLEAKRQQMMANAEWRQNQRVKNLNQHQKESQVEDAMLKKYKNVAEEKAKFIRKMQVESYSSKDTSSVEDRIRRTIHSKQRTNASLDKKFTSR